MAYFPGNVMVIDDQYEVIFKERPSEKDKQIQFDALVDIKSYCENTGIPLVQLSETQDIGSLIGKIQLYQNVRLLILDLDLNNDGNVNPEDDHQTIYAILKAAIAQFGYFILMINSAHATAWDDIIQGMPEEINKNLMKNLTYVYDKSGAEKVYNSLEKIGANYSLEIIYHFESYLNEARDKAFHSFLDFEKDSWGKIFKTLEKESGIIAHNDISNILISILKQHLLHVAYPDVKNGNNLEVDSQIKYKVYNSLNYLRNPKVLSKQKIWTGNLYKTTLGNDKQYALVINPECDIAQEKNIYFKVVYGFERNDATLPRDYDNSKFAATDVPPLFPLRAGRDRNKKWKSLKELSGTSKINDHMIHLPFTLEGDSGIFIDFRDVASISGSDFINWTLLLRINDPFITNIIDSYSNLFNRKGLLPI